MSWIDHERARLSVLSAAADEAWRAWRYPPGNRTAAARDRPELAMTAASPDERERRAETAWQEALRRDLRNQPAGP